MESDRSIYKITMVTMINVLFFLCFFVYIKKLPIDIETQPLYIFGFCVALLFVSKQNITKKDYSLLLQLFILIAYAGIQFALFRTGIVPFLVYLIGPIIYFIFQNRIALLALSVIKQMVVVYFILTLIFIFQPPILLDGVLWINNHLISRAYWVEGSSIRGVPLLAPESSYFAFPLLLLLILLDIRFENTKDASLKKYRYILYFIAICTKSALVFCYLLVYLIGKHLRFFSFANLKKMSTTRNLMVLCLIIFLISSPFLFLRHSRPVQVIENISRSLATGNYFELIFRESSGSTRIIINTIGTISVIKKPLGWGLGEFKNNYFEASSTGFKDVIQRHEVLNYFHKNNKPMKTQTYITNLIGDIGIFAFPMVFFFYCTFREARGDIKRGLKYVLLLMLVVVQGQLSNPMIWVLLAILNSSDSHLGLHKK